MEKIFIQFDEAEYNNRLSRYKLYVTKLQVVLDAYNAMKLPALNTGEFRALLRNFETTIFDKMNNGESFSLAGMELDKAKAMELLTKPEGYNTLETLIKDYQQVVNWDHYINSIIIKDGIVKVCDSVCKTEKEATTLYAQTDDQIKALKFAKKIMELVKEYWEDGRFQNLGDTVNKLIHRREDRINGGYVYDLDFKQIKNFGGY